MTLLSSTEAKSIVANVCQKKAAVAVVPRQIGHHCHFILDLVTQVALQGSGIGGMGRVLVRVVGAVISKILSTWAMGAGREN